MSRLLRRSWRVRGGRSLYSRLGLPVPHNFWLNFMKPLRYRAWQWRFRIRSGARLRADLARLHNVLDSAASQGVGTLGRVADRVCDAFNLSDARGRRQRAKLPKGLGRVGGEGPYLAAPAATPERRGAQAAGALAPCGVGARCA